MDIQLVLSSVGEPLRRYNYIVELPMDFGNADRLKYQVFSVTVPAFFDFDIERMEYAPGFALEFPSAFGEKEPVEIEFWEDEDLTVYNYFYNWRTRMVNLDTDDADVMNFNLRKTYVRDVIVYVVNVKGSICGGFKIREAFPTKVQSYAMGYGDNEVVHVRVEFRYKDIIPVGGK